MLPLHHRAAAPETLPGSSVAKRFRLKHISNQKPPRQGLCPGERCLCSGLSAATRATLPASGPFRLNARRAVGPDQGPRPPSWLALTRAVPIAAAGQPVPPRRADPGRCPDRRVNAAQHLACKVMH
jgi:hypothetical protein